VTSAIAVDTNVLVRLVVEDDTRQAALARRLIEDAASDGAVCYVNLPVLCELEWVLASCYQAPRTEIADVMAHLMENPAFALENRASVAQALAAFRQGRAGFADHLIGVQAQAFGAATTWTFDRALRGRAGFSVLR
jgi:predicted nucleic-acid-binding protein